MVHSDDYVTVVSECSNRRPFELGTYGYISFLFRLIREAIEDLKKTDGTSIRLDVSSYATCIKVRTDDNLISKRIAFSAFHYGPQKHKGRDIEQIRDRDTDIWRTIFNSDYSVFQIIQRYLYFEYGKLGDLLDLSSTILVPLYLLDLTDPTNPFRKNIHLRLYVKPPPSYITDENLWHGLNRVDTRLPYSDPCKIFDQFHIDRVNIPRVSFVVYHHDYVSEVHYGKVAVENNFDQEYDEFIRSSVTKGRERDRTPARSRN